MKKRILIAEDDQFLGETIQAALQDHGADAQLVCNGEQAVTALEAEQPDLLLLDLIMPKKDGLHVLRHVHAKGYRFPVVILSNLSGDLAPQQYAALGARDYMVKSDMDEADLWPRIRKYL